MSISWVVITVYGLRITVLNAVVALCIYCFSDPLVACS
jgi:hypothetical protein